MELAYVDQSRDALDAEKTVWEEITGGVDRCARRRARCTSRAYVAGFNFNGADQQKKVGDLSGGERNRVHLAKLLRSGGNLLLLDEPTNDLDVDTLRALEEALERFAGCAVVISHDRWFLDRVATHCSRSRATARCAGSRARSTSTSAGGARRWARTRPLPACATSRSCATSAATHSGSDAPARSGRQPTARLVCDTHAADRPHGGLPPRRPLRKPRRPGAGAGARRRA